MIELTLTKSNQIYMLETDLPQVSIAAKMYLHVKLTV